MQNLPDDGSCRWTAAMRRGDFESAWQQTDRIEEARRKLQKVDGFERSDHQLVWNGEPFHGRDVLIRCWHGFGDTLQFIRYCPLVKALAKSVHVEVQPALLELFDGMEGIDYLIDGWNATTEGWHGVEIECMELTYAFRHNTQTLPRAVPYLPVDRLLKRRSLPGVKWPNQPRIGLVWASSEWDRDRSVLPSDLEPLKLARNAAVFSFQQDRPDSDHEAFSFPVTALSSSTRNIADAAVGLLSMDLIITVDCMMAHLAGALGRPVWVLLKHEPDWRWLEQGTDSPWYPTMRLFRQPERGDWRTPISEIASLLEGFFASGDHRRGARMERYAQSSSPLK
jgi:hypothetical protein